MFVVNMFTYVYRDDPHWTILMILMIWHDIFGGIPHFWIDPSDVVALAVVLRTSWGFPGPHAGPAEMQYVPVNDPAEGLSYMMCLAGIWFLVD